MTQLALVVLASGALNAVYGTVGISLLIGVVFPALIRRRLALNVLSSPIFWLLSVFGITYVIIGSATIQSMLYYLITPLLAFAAGWIIAENRREKRAEYLLHFIFCLVVGYGTHAFLNYVINIGNVRWKLVDFYSGLVRAATGSGCINTMVFSLATYILWIEKRIIYRLGGITLFVISLLYAFLLGSRTQFIIMLVVTFVSSVMLFYERNKAAGLLRLIAIFALSALTLLLLYENDIAGIRSFIEESNLMARFDPQSKKEIVDADNYRMASIAAGLINVFEHPLGGMVNTVYYHNMWLDIGRVSGLIPFLLMIVYSLITLVHVFFLFRDKQLSESFRYVLLCVYLGVMLNFCTEPILEGLKDFFYVFCLINGMVECYYSGWRQGYANC